MTRHSPTLEAAAVSFVLSVIGFGSAYVGAGPTLFALSLPLTVHPWTVVTSVYTHASIAHLVLNLVAFVLAGLVVERRTTRLRFHGFVLLTGMLSGVATVLVGAILGRSVAVIGLSGAVLALFGYLLAGNLVTDLVVGRLSPSRRTLIPVVLGLAVVVTVATGGPNVAYTAHLTGFALGLLTGRFHLLRA